MFEPMLNLTEERKQYKKYNQAGFTLTELLSGALIASLTVAAGMSISQVIVNNNKQSERNSAVIELADNAIDQIQQEIRNGEQLVDLESDLPKGCDTYKKQGIEFLFAVDIPDQAMSLGAYDITSGKPDLKAVKCPIIYGTTGNTEEIKLHRIGININKYGYYTADEMSDTEVLGNIGTSTTRSLECPSGKWKHIKRGGIEVCIDQRLKRMAKLTITVKNGRDLPGITTEGSTTQRQGSAMTEVMKQDAVAGANSKTVSKCKSGSGCNFGGQPISCDKTSFVIDVSGSMGLGGNTYPGWGYIWRRKNGRLYVDGGPNSRMERAKRELLRAIDSCSDEAEINVTAFSSNGSWTEKTAWNSPKKLTSSNRNYLKQLIQGMVARGGTDPWRYTHKMVQDQNVKEIVLLSDGGTYNSGSVRLGGKYYNGEFAKSYNSYSNTFRTNNPIKIKTVSFGGGNYCGGGWMGRLADMNGGSCVVAQ